MTDEDMWRAWASGSVVTNWEAFGDAAVKTVADVVREDCVASLRGKLEVVRVEENKLATELSKMSARRAVLHAALHRVATESDWAKVYREACAAG